MKYLFLMAIAIFAAVGAYGQKEKKESLFTMKEEWFEGTALTTKGEELEGLIWYNDTNGVLSFRDGNKARAYSARSLSGFEFFDENLQKQRVFYSLSYDDPEIAGGEERPYFFEVIRDFKSFAIISKADPMETQLKQNTGDFADGSYIQASQTETIYFLNTNGKIAPYLRVIRKESDGRLWFDKSKEKNKLVDEDLLAEYVGQDEYLRLQRYAEENDLKFRRKKDFLKILEYYASNLSSQ